MVDDTEISELESIKFFGIHFDQGLTWNHHIDNKCKKHCLQTFTLEV